MKLASSPHRGDTSGASSPLRWLPRWEWLLAIVIVLLPITVAGAVIPTPRHVREITLVNESEYSMTVQVGGEGGEGGEGDGWSGLGLVRREDERSVRDVLDQGGQWTFSLDAQGHHVGELRIERSDLEARDWTVTIPTQIADRLREEGVPPSPD